LGLLDELLDPPPQATYNKQVKTARVSKILARMVSKERKLAGPKLYY